MFTNGELNPWRGFSAQASRDFNPDAPDRPSMTQIPKCNGPPNGNELFGMVYPGAVHAKDLFGPIIVEVLAELNPVEQGLTLFSKALDEWLPCFWEARGGKPE